MLGVGRLGMHEVVERWKVLKSVGLGLWEKITCFGSETGVAVLRLRPVESAAGSRVSLLDINHFWELWAVSSVTHLLFLDAQKEDTQWKGDAFRLAKHLAISPLRESHSLVALTNAHIPITRYVLPVSATQYHKIALRSEGFVLGVLML